MKKLNEHEITELTSRTRDRLLEMGKLEEGEVVHVIFRIKKALPAQVKVSVAELVGEDLDEFLACRPGDEFSLCGRPATFVSHFLTIGHMARWLRDDCLLSGFGPVTRTEIVEMLESHGVPETMLTLPLGEIERKTLLGMSIQEFFASELLWSGHRVRTNQESVIKHRCATLGELVHLMGDSAQLLELQESLPEHEQLPSLSIGELRKGLRSLRLLE